MPHTEKKISGKNIYEGKIVRLSLDQAQLENGRVVSREVITHPGGVGIVAIDSEENILLVQQFRYPFGQELIEIPAGKLEYGEDHRACGIRELEEETGQNADIFHYLGYLYPTPAYNTEITHLYYATGLHETRQHLDEDEFLSVLRIPFQEAVTMVLDGKIPDAKTQLGILKVAMLKEQGKL